jgi:nucleoside-diphosphate-sugar epimerase
MVRTFLSYGHAALISGKIMLVDNSTIIVTGSSGYVASDLIPRLKKSHEVFGVDVYPSEHTAILANINSRKFSEFIDNLSHNNFTLINLAAARLDFGATAEDYFRTNVGCHEAFLKSLSGHKIKKFIHISSVAVFDGKKIPYSEELNCDDAYRATKYLQEELIQNWCDDQGIELTIVYPSAIFSRDPRSDTNIGKLQSISKFLPFIPSIAVVKSLTYLPNFSRFIIDLVTGEIPAGKYLTIEKPSLTVSRMIQIISGRPIRLIKIPCFQFMMQTVANFLHILGGFGKIDLKLTPNRVVKLFSDTSYSDLDGKDIDAEAYVVRNKDQLSDLLKNFNDT